MVRTEKVIFMVVLNKVVQVRTPAQIQER